MITSETPVRDFQKSEPLPSFRFSGPKTNPFVPGVPASITGTGANVEFEWRSEGVPGVASGSEVEPLKALVERLRRDLGRFPKSAMVRVNLASALAKQGATDEAEGELRNALELDKHNYLARVTLARLLHQAGKLDEAKKLYDEILVDSPSDNTALLSLAVMALRRNDYSEAEGRLHLLSRGREGDATIHFLLGVIRLRKNDLRGAVAELRAASHLDVRNPTIHQALGVIFAVRSEFDRAEQEFRAALTLTPNDRASIRSLYQVLLNQSKAEEAVDLLKRFVEENPGDLSAQEWLALALFDLGKFSSARFYLSRMLGEGVERIPVDQFARIQANIGLMLFKEGKIDEARKALMRAVELYPEVSPIAYENLARLYLSQEDAKSASDVLLKSLRLFPGSAATTVLLSLVQSRLGDIQGAIKSLNAFRGRSDATVEVYIYIYLSFLYTLIDDPDESINVAREGLKTFGNSAPLLNNLAYVYAMTDRLEEARATLRMVPKDIPPTVELSATRGLIKLREGDERQGVELYEAAERLAKEAGNKDLARRARQKKHLELARFFIRKRAFEKARVELNRGLAITVTNFSYDDDLQRLSKSLEGIASA